MQSLIDDLMGSDNVNTFVGSNGDTYAVRVVGPGVDLFFRENGRGLICAFDAIGGVIHAKAFKSWDKPVQRMNETERARVLELIVACYRRVYGKDLVVVR